MALLWPGATRTSTQNSLRQALYHLLQAVPEVSTTEGAGSVPLVLSDRQMVWINQQASFELDVAIFARYRPGL